MLQFDDAFLPMIAERYWQREPVQFAVDPGRSPFDAASVFHALSAPVAHDPLDWLQVAARADPTNVRHFRMVPFRTHGPRADDGDFAGYFDRLSTMSFGFNVHDLGRRDPALLARTAAFRDALTAVPGSPVVRRWELDAFVGNYRATPLGIHRDNGGVFSFCLVGRRTYLLWPPEYFASNHPDLTKPDPAIIDRHAHAATRIDVEPGYGVYWPSNRWHVVLSSGEPFAVAQVSAYFDQADLPENSAEE